VPKAAIVQVDGVPFDGDVWRMGLFNALRLAREQRKRLAIHATLRVSASSEDAWGRKEETCSMLHLTEVWAWRNKAEKNCR
jgi:hypothetical protein